MASDGGVADEFGDRRLDVSLGTLAGGAVLLWVLGELLLRWVGVAALAGPVGSARGADMLLVGVGFPLLAVAIAAWGRRAGVSRADWEYDWSLRPVLAGVGGVVVYFVGFSLFTVGYVAVFGTPETPGAGITDSPALWVLASLLVVNGVVVPFAEELAWRGVIQTALTREYGALVGVGVTALAFVLKHVVVDAAAPVLRVASLVVIALVLGLLRHRYGTASSTVAHLGANGLATASLVIPYL